MQLFDRGDDITHAISHDSCALDIYEVGSITMDDAVGPWYMYVTDGQQHCSTVLVLR